MEGLHAELGLGCSGPGASALQRGGFVLWTSAACPMLELAKTCQGFKQEGGSMLE